MYLATGLKVPNIDFQYSFKNKWLNTTTEFLKTILMKNIMQIHNTLRVQ